MPRIFISFSKCLLVLSLFSLTACSALDKLIYSVDINQGNYINEDIIRQLRFGMTKDQVKYLLGSPMLVLNGEPQKWIYVYYQKKGHAAPTQKKLVVFFDDQNRLINMKSSIGISEQFRF